MSPPAKHTAFLRNYHATPLEWQRDLFHCVVRGGHLRGGTDHHIERDTYPGHEFILCLNGRGWVQVAGRRHNVGPGDLLWVNCHHPHQYGAVRSDPWELYWIRVEGRVLDRLAELLEARPRPVFSGIASEFGRSAFEQIFDRLESGRPCDAAHVNAVVASLLAAAFESRLGDARELRPELPQPVQRALERMRLYFHTPIRVADLAALAGMSESHFSRQFKASVGTSPIDWLRRERINQAKRRLAESDDAVKEIARQAGYTDQFFFSKDFKRMTGLTPSQFRDQERH